MTMIPSKKVLSRIIRALRNGPFYDIWYDAEDNHDRAGEHRIANTQACMFMAAEIIPQINKVRELEASLGQLLDQVEMMRGLFPDEDGAIDRAIKDAEQALERN